MKTKLLLTLLIIFSFKSLAQTFTFNDYQNYVLTNYDFKSHYDSKRNLYIEKNIVHIFIDENGNLIETGIPTTAIESYSYKLHLITNTKTIIIDHTEFSCSYKGEYKPTLNIQNETITDNNPNAIRATEKITEFSYATIGPFTKEFTIILKKKETGSNEQTILDKTINVAKTYHVSISTGLFMTTLKNPSNIKESTNSKGEKTLVADEKIHEEL